MSNFQMINGVFYSFCHDCGAKIKGEEKLKGGNAGNQGRKDVHFYCRRCNKYWWKDKTRLLVSIQGGYYNGFGEWIRADENGNPLPQDVEKARQKRMKEEEKEMKKVIFRPKSHYQKEDCLYPKCPNNKSTLEAVVGVAAIRCCENEACKQDAAKMAKFIDATWRKKE